MNPWGLTASELLVWGIVLHLVADWPLQNHWMANHKQNLLHPAAYLHAMVHVFLLTFVFGWAAFALGFVHLLIDTRKPVEWWSKLVRQTQPENRYFFQRSDTSRKTYEIMVYDIGTEVRFWTDQVFHIACVAVAALLIA